MFPHNSSSHEISTETNAFVQNSKGDVVLLMASCPSGVEEGRRPDSVRSCDIKSANNTTMARPTSHPVATTTTNDFITVLPRQSGELGSAAEGKACQSVASAITKNPAKHLLIYDNNKINNHNNAEHNHHKYRTQNKPGSPGQLGSSADNSKSISKLLSDNKDSFSDLSIRVLQLSLKLKVTRGEVRQSAGEPSLVRIPKSDCPPWLSHESSVVENYSLLGSRLDKGENNNLKANLRFISNNNYSKSVILLSSTRDGDYYLLSESGGVREDTALENFRLKNNSSSRWESVKLLAVKYSPVTKHDGACRKLTQNDLQNVKLVILYSDGRLFYEDHRLQDSQNDLDVLDIWFNRPNFVTKLLKLHFDNTATLGLLSLAQAQNFATCSSNSLIVSTNESTSLLRSLTDENLTKVEPSRHATVNELMQRICVPLMIECKVYVNGSNNNNIVIGEEMNINNNNPDVIEDIVNVAVCYKTSCTMTTNYRLGFQNDGISYTQATMFTVGALSFQDNNKSNKPLHASFKDDNYQVSAKIDDKFNFNHKSVSKSTLSVRFSDKSETSHATRLNKSDEKMHVLSAVNIPTLTTCEPTMTLKCQPATVASQTNTVPASQVEKHSKVDDKTVLLKSSYLKYDHESTTSNRNSSNHDQNANDFVSLNEESYENDIGFSNTLKNDEHDNDNEDYDDDDDDDNDDDITPKNILQSEKYYQMTSFHDGCAARNDDNCNDNGKRLNTNRPTSNIQKMTELFAIVRDLLSRYQKVYKSDLAQSEIICKQLQKALPNLFNRPYSCNKMYQSSLEYKKRWGIPIISGLAGGGESSLNTGTATSWGSAPPAAPNNNNNNAAQSGWGGTPGNPPVGTGPPNNWGGNNVNRPVTANPNQNQNQGPSGQNIPGEGNVNKVTNPNQSQNPQSGPTTSQSTNATSGNQNNGQWPQGKSSNPGGSGQSQSSQNNNNPSQQSTQPGSSANNNPTNSATSSTVNNTTTAVANNPSSKQQLEQLNTMREALFSQDGWGSQHVNQDTSWEVPTSPEPSMTKDGVPMWKPPVNNGTELWEANLRNGGQPPPQQQAKTPWGHTPSTNIGGTWGEDDDAADSSNMWSGAPTPNPPSTAQWPGAAANQSSGMSGGGTSWGDPRMDPRDPRDLRTVDPREMRDPRDHRISLDPRDHMRVMDPMSRDPRMPDMRGDPRGISGRLNGASADAMWGQPPGPQHHQMSHQHPTGPPAKMVNPSGINQWVAPPPKEMMPGKPSGWEEPSPPTQRRNVPNYDDGTSLWGNPAPNPRPMPGGKVSHWKELPTPNMGRGGMPCPPGMPQNRMPGQPGMKPDVSGPMWGHPTGPGGSGGGGGAGGGGSGTGGGGGAGRNGSWGDGPHDTASWEDQKTPSAWNEPPINPPASWGGPTSHKPKPMGPTGGWGDTEMDPTTSWAHPPKQMLTKEVIWNSREFRYLCDLGYKVRISATPKEDVETALRNREMNRDEAHELLIQVRPQDHWRRQDSHTGYDPASQSAAAAGYPPRFNHVAQQISFPPGAGMPSVGASGGMSGSVASASLLKLQQQQQQQAAVQLQQQQPSVTAAPQPPFNQTSRTPQNQPSTQQLRMLVQQIQLAVQEGYLNHQILNQPLAPQTLILLNQLLQQIKVLQQLHQQHSVQLTLKGNSQTGLQISVQITKTKQQIANLQNQIAVQQATYMKQQQQQQHPATPSQASDYYKTSVHDPMSALQNTFSDLTMNKEPQVSQQQSRLNQWKLPSLDKEGDLGTNEFSRAPGTTSKPPTTPGGLTQSHSSPNMNPLLGQGDGTWSSRLGDSGWPDAGTSDSTDGKDWQPGGAAFTDLVPEFEPGKPWKMKSIEDDPSITPGSVVRSPLSLAAIKDPDAIFSSTTKTSPPPSANADTSIPSLSNSTWSFNPPATTPSVFASSKNTWGESAPPPTAVTSELWGAPMSKARGPPPGLGSKGGASASNGWVGLAGVNRSSSSWGLQSGAVGNAAWVSTWLLLKNLTPQIDGSTLKTLCMQHGPVQDFRLYLNHGIALAKYSSRDEAIKAQGALNNCVLGNTTIFAESPADSEVHTLLQHLGHGGQQQTAGTAVSGWGLRTTSKAGPPPDTWGGSSSQLWGAPPGGNSLWSNAGIDSGDQQRATPSSLNSYLPGDLLGDEYPSSKTSQISQFSQDLRSRYFEEHLIYDLLESLKMPVQ
ncbi:trinucleotide repeat-containing gene 6C protein-like isoform X3 [Neodiprion fabricii]|uniref:trinucleotide repeat-containing gene 6C protein-like isoform X3 n=1 Tax=Neodiprion fabricii TaxID=2872261 RepID=UPI001ED8F6E9|nr:trinucleotide repeat-containing gene 6C protein-like isoform X3 [Neodiprion fabricii]